MKDTEFQHARDYALKYFSATRPKRQAFKLTDIGEEHIKGFICASLENDVIGDINFKLIEKQLAVAHVWIRNQTSKASLLLLGKVGTGKTTIANAIYGAFDVCKSAKLISADITLKKITTTELMKKNDYELQAFCECDVLLLDDLGIERIEKVDYGNVQTPVIDVLLARYEARRTTIITSNLDGQTMRERYGERIYDRLREMCQIVTFTNESFRR